MRRPVSAASPVASWLYNTQLHQAALAGHTVLTSSAAGLPDTGYITIGKDFVSFFCGLLTFKKFESLN